MSDNLQDIEAHNPAHCPKCENMILRLKNANNILRAAMYDIIELESGQHTTKVTQLFAKNALDKSAL